MQRGEFVQMLRLRAQSDRDKALSDKDILSLFRIFDQNSEPSAPDLNPQLTPRR